MTPSLIENVIWAATAIGEAALLTTLLRKRRWREFPVFTAIIAYELAVSVAMVPVSRSASRHAYFLAYWITAFVDYAFQVALIAEIARSVLSPARSWIRGAWRSFLLWAGLGTLFAIALSFTIGASGAVGLDLWEVRLRVFTSLLTCELFLAMSAAANRLGLPWRSHVMAIGQGLTVWAAVALLGDIGHVILGWNRSFAVFDYLHEGVFFGVLVFWTVALWLPEKSRQPLSPDMQKYLLALHRRVQYDLERVRPADKPTA